MPLTPGSEPTGTGEPPDYARDHPDEDPEQWGWHGEWGRAARAGGWIVAAIVVVMTTATNYQLEYHVALWILAAAIVTVLVRDRNRRRNWRR
jgi:hypothetical protein